MTSEERTAIDSSTKIVVVHHHPFPVPYEGKDTFLMLKNAQTFIQFLAERKIDIVLHGHKHRAPHSLLELGTCVGRNRVIEVIGAGTAIAENDQDQRGNNFNLIMIEDNGLRYVRQFFAQRGEEFREIPGASFSSNAFESSYRKALACNYKYRKVHWDLEIDDEGDGKNLMSFIGASPVGDVPLDAIELPETFVVKGHLSPPSLYRRYGKTSENVEKPVAVPADPGKVKLKIPFKNSLTEASPADFALLYYGLNAFALDLSEYRRKYRTDDGVEWAQKKIVEPMEEFSFALHLPATPSLESPPWFEVFPVTEPESGAEPALVKQKRHEWLTKELQRCFYYSSVLNTGFLSIRKPPAGYLYRISWCVPASGDKATKGDLRGQIRWRKFVSTLLKMRALTISPPNPGSVEFDELTKMKPVQDVVNKALAVFVESASKQIEEEKKLKGLVQLDADNLDITLMVYDDTDANEPPKLRIVAGSCRGNPSYFKFSLDVGDGNAGRAYKKKIVRPFDRQKAEDDPKNQTYVGIPGTPQHEILYSIPLLDPGAPSLIFGILNFGTFSENDGEVLRTLDDRASHEWMINQAQSYVLTKLLEELKL